MSADQAQRGAARSVQARPCACDPRPSPATAPLRSCSRNEPPELAGKTAQVPEPSRVPTRSEIAVIRGHADAAALAVACHDPGLHAALAPSGGEARAVFEAIEQARVEAIGAKRMRGISANLAARLEQRYERTRVSDASDRSEAPLPEALALLVRERLTGLSHRPRRELSSICGGPGSRSRGHQVLDRMPETLFDQDAFGRLTRDLLAALNLADQLDQRGEESSENQENEAETGVSRRRGRGFRGTRTRRARLRDAERRRRFWRGERRGSRGGWRRPLRPRRR